MEVGLWKESRHSDKDKKQLFWEAVWDNQKGLGAWAQGLNPTHEFQHQPFYNTDNLLYSVRFALSVKRRQWIATTKKNIVRNEKETNYKK